MVGGLDNSVSDESELFNSHTAECGEPLLLSRRETIGQVPFTWGKSNEEAGNRAG